MSMPIINVIKGSGIPLRGNDIDTDRIIPARFLKCVTFDGLGDFAFADDIKGLEAQGKTHPFRDPIYAKGSILVSNQNFGCGSSREHAPQALKRWGVRAIIAESYSEIFFETIAGEVEPKKGNIKWGTTINYNYFPRNNDKFFNTDLTLVDWLRQYSVEQDETFIRGFLGRMLFTGEEALKSSKVLSGGEKVRCMLSRMMLSNANTLLLDEPTSHLDLESITALNNGLKAYAGPVIFCTQDHEFAQTVANRILELTSTGYVDRTISFDEWLESKKGKRK
jgi:ABC-type dipeptide/oligopeptide/nickel transport system ATPase subunit